MDHMNLAGEPGQKREQDMRYPNGNSLAAALADTE